MDKEDFKKDLEEIVRLFKLLKEKAEKTNNIDIDSSHYKQIEMFVQSYDMVKDNINEQMLNQFGEPIKDMMKEMIEQLKEELGDEFLYTTPQSVKKEVKAKADKVIEVGPSVEEIDRMLKAPNLSDSEINNLLDLRKRTQKNHDN